jgi:hypothetical protein
MVAAAHPLHSGCPINETPTTLDQHSWVIPTFLTSFQKRQSPKSATVKCSESESEVKEGRINYIKERREEGRNNIKEERKEEIISRKKGENLSWHSTLYRAER